MARSAPSVAWTCLGSRESTITDLPPTRRRFRWIKWIALGFTVLLVLLLILGLSIRAYFTHRAEKDFQAAVAELEQSEAGWSWADLEAKRAVVAPEENSATPILAAAEMLPHEWSKQPLIDARELGPEDAEGKFPAVDTISSQIWNTESNRRFNPMWSPHLRREWQNLKNPIAEARKVIEMPKGRFSITIAKNLLDTLLPHLSAARSVNFLLCFDSAMRAEERDLVGALISVRGLLNSTRCIGDEPYSISVLVRVEGDELSVKSLERILGQGEPSVKELRSLSPLLEQEEASLQANLVNAVRGDRAMLADVYAKIYSGDLTISELSKKPDTPSWWDRTFDWCWSRPVFYHYLPGMFRITTRIVQLAKQPRWKRLRDVKALDAELRAKYKDPERKLEVFLIPAFIKVFDLHDRTLGSLRCTRVALAVEQYRRMHKAWPETLDQLVPDFLTKVPDDPFRDGPLQMRRLDDGMIIYSVGSTEENGEGPVDPTEWKRPRMEPFFRLWDPGSRALPPVPKP